VVLDMSVHVGPPEVGAARGRAVSLSRLGSSPSSRSVRGSGPRGRRCRMVIDMPPNADGLGRGRPRHPALTRTDHRPWALPAGRWTWRQSWRDLLFVHWPVPAAALRPLVPADLAIQEFDGTSWVGVVPFRMTGVMRRPLPDVPGLSAFPELNVRLYVEADEKPGVWFLSLDASNALAVWAARRLFHLPYHLADITIARDGSDHVYASQRRNAPERFVARYGPRGAVYEAVPGTLEHWLTERYCLYATAPDGRLLRSEVHHLPWPLQGADAAIETNTMLDSFDLDRPSRAPHLLFAARLDVVVWDGRSVDAA
jgi:uncharacterized protein